MKDHQRNAMTPEQHAKLIEDAAIEYASASGEPAFYVLASDLTKLPNPMVSGVGAGLLKEPLKGVIACYTHPQPAAQAGEDAKRLDWLEASQDGVYHNIDRIAAIKGIGFLTGPLTQQDKHETLREAIDAAIAVQGELKWN